MSTLSERMRDTWLTSRPLVVCDAVHEWADEVEALEERLLNVLEVAIARGEKLGYADEDYRVLLMEHELSPKDKLLQGYESIGMTSALIAKKRYGRRSAFDE